MMRQPPSAAFLQFVDDELLRAPLVAEQVMDATLESISRGLPGMAPRDRSAAADLMQQLHAHRRELVGRFVSALREQVTTELDGSALKPPPASAAAPRTLSLVDEDEVAVDVGIVHATESIKSVAEYELRELLTFTSALAGDMDVARDNNPFRAEAQARALWAVASALPLSRGFQVTFMRHAGMPLAQVLRKAYAASAARLEGQGIEPAAYRTVILPAGARSARANDSTGVPELTRIRDSMPVPLDAAPPAAPRQRSEAFETLLRNQTQQWQQLQPDAGSAEHGRLRDSQHAALMGSAPNKVDQQLIELFSRLFDAILSDRRLPKDLQLVVSRLQPSLLRVALRDDTTLDDERHAVWQFVDHIAFLGQILPDPGVEDRERIVRYLHQLIDKLIESPQPDGRLYDIASERLLRLERQRFEKRLASAGEKITALQAMESPLALRSDGAPSVAGALDVAQLDTVPAGLMDLRQPDEPRETSSSAWLAHREPGDWARMFMQGRWVHAQLLWIGAERELWLWADSDSHTTWAVRRRALQLLHGENLLQLLQPRSLIRSAATRVMKRLQTAASAPA